jgi:NitT/TauT family transport system ATP-binding protein
MLTLDRVCRRFPNGTEALRDVSLHIGEGEFVALLGKSGCGKSTLLRLIAGLDAPGGGGLVWSAGEKPKPGEIGYVFQDATLLPWASAADNVWLPLRLAGVSRAASASRVQQALARVGLAEFANAKPRQLSGGMRMRVSLARALVTAPRLLLMDEPFAALDEFTRHRLQADLRAVWGETGCTIVFVTHSIQEAAFLAGRIVLMSPQPGRIAAEIGNTLPETGADRLDPSYAALAARIGAALRDAEGETA